MLLHADANASCIDSHIDKAIEIVGAVCFEGCPRGPTPFGPDWTTGDCYLKCYLNTLLGDPAYNISKADTAQIVGPWCGILPRALVFLAHHSQSL